MEERENLSIEELIVTYTDLLAQHGAKSRAAQRFLKENSSNEEFMELAQTARDLKSAYEELRYVSERPLHLERRNQFWLRLFDFRLVALGMVALLGIAISYVAIQNVQTSNRLYAQLQRMSNAIETQPTLVVYRHSLYKFTPSERRLMSVDATKGNVLWSSTVRGYNVGETVKIQPTDEFVFLSTADRLYQFDARTGAVRATSSFGPTGFVPVDVPVEMPTKEE